MKNRDLLEAMIEDRTRRKRTSEWLEILDGSGMPYAAVNDIQGTMNHKHGKTFFMISWQNYRRKAHRVVLARNMVREVNHPTCGPMKLVNIPVKFSYSEPSIRTAPPLLGQHTDEVLTDVLGMSDSDINHLRKEGVIA